MPVVIAILALIVLAFLWAWHLDRKAKRNGAREASPAELTHGADNSRTENIAQTHPGSGNVGPNGGIQGGPLGRRSRHARPAAAQVVSASSSQRSSTAARSSDSARSSTSRASTLAWSADASAIAACSRFS